MARAATDDDTRATRRGNGALPVRNPYPNIKALIYERDTTQRKIARAAEIDETHLSDIIRGRRVPTADEKRSIAKALGASIRECFADTAA